MCFAVSYIFSDYVEENTHNFKILELVVGIDLKIQFDLRLLLYQLKLYHRNINIILLVEVLYKHSLYVHINKSL